MMSHTYNNNNNNNSNRSYNVKYVTELYVFNPVKPNDATRIQQKQQQL